MYPKCTFDKIVIFYKNDKMHHVRVDYSEWYDQNRMVSKNRYVYPNDLKKEFNSIVSYNKRIGNYDFNINNLIVYSNYEKMSQQAIDNEKKLAKERRKEDYASSDFAYFIDQVDERIFELKNNVRNIIKKKNINVKKIGAISLTSILAISGVAYSLNTLFKPKVATIKTVNNSVEIMMNEGSLELEDIDNVLNFIGNVDNGSAFETKDSRDLCEKLFKSYNTNIPVYKTIINRFISSGGLMYLNNLPPKYLEHICMYGTNLIMGGDNYGFFGGSMVPAMSLDTKKDIDYYTYVTYLCKEYNVDDERVMYSAIPAESHLFNDLPPLIRYVILSQTEKAVSKIQFEYKGRAKPTWWFKSTRESYNFEKLLEEIGIKKDECRKEIYQMYSQDKNSKSI